MFYKKMLFYCVENTSPCGENCFKVNPTPRLFDYGWQTFFHKVTKFVRLLKIWVIIVSYV